MDNKSPFEEYRKVKDQIAILEQRKVELEMDIFDYLDSDGITNKETPYGQFCIMGRKTYEYTAKVKEWAEELKKMKKVEELEGKATLKSDSRYVRLIIPKGDE